MPVGMWMRRTADAGLVDVLAARAGGAVDLHFNVLGTNVDLDVVGQLGHDLERGEARLAAGVRVERGNAHQTVDAVLALEIAVGVLALDHDRRALDAGLVAVEIVQHLELEAVLVRPLHIHAVEHLRPVLRLGAARAGVEGQNGVAVIVLAGEQRREADLLRSASPDRRSPPPARAAGWRRPSRCPCR